MAEGCKKVVASGARTLVLMREERCFGIENAEVADETVNLGTWKETIITSESLVNDIGTLTSNALNPERAVKRRVQGVSNPGGDLNIELANNGYGYMITQAVGKIVGTGIVGDPYTIIPVDANGVNSDDTAGYKQDSALYNDTEINYDVTASDASDSAGFEKGYYTVDPQGLEPGMDIMISRDGGTIKDEDGNSTTNPIWFLYTGSKVNSWTVTIAPDAITVGTFTLLSREETYFEMATPTYTSRPEINDPFSGFNAAVEVDGVSSCILNLNFTLTNNLSESQLCLGDKRRNSSPEGQRQITGTFEVEFQDLTYYAKYVNGTSVTIVVDFDLLGDNTETMRIIFPKIEYEGTTPNAAGQDAINVPIPFTALWDDSPADSILTKGATLTTPNGFDIAIEIVTAGTLV